MLDILRATTTIIGKRTIFHHLFLVDLSLDLTMFNKSFYQLVRTAPTGRWDGIKRSYEAKDVNRLRSSVQIEYTLAVSRKMN